MDSLLDRLGSIDTAYDTLLAVNQISAPKNMDDPSKKLRKEKKLLRRLREKRFQQEHAGHTLPVRPMSAVSRTIDRADSSSNSVSEFRTTLDSKDNLSPDYRSRVTGADELAHSITRGELTITKKVEQLSDSNDLKVHIKNFRVGHFNFKGSNDSIKKLKKQELGDQMLKKHRRRYQHHEVAPSDDIDKLIGVVNTNEAKTSTKEFQDPNSPNPFNQFNLTRTGTSMNTVRANHRRRKSMGTMRIRTTVSSGVTRRTFSRRRGGGVNLRRQVMESATMGGAHWHGFRKENDVHQMSSVKKQKFFDQRKAEALRRDNQFEHRMVDMQERVTTPTPKKQNVPRPKKKNVSLLRARKKKLQSAVLTAAQLKKRSKSLSRKLQVVHQQVLAEKAGNKCEDSGEIKMDEVDIIQGEEWGWNKARQLVRALSLVNQWRKNNTSIVRRTNTTRNTKKSSITAKQFPTLSSMFDTATPSKPSSLNFSSLSSSHAEKKAETEAEKYEAATFAYLYLCEQDMHVPNTKNLERANAVGQDWTLKLGDKSLGQSEFKAVLKSVELSHGWKDVKTFHVANNRINHSSFLHLQRAFEQGHCITDIDLSSNDLSFMGSTELARAIAHTSVVKLNLKNCKLRDSALEAIVVALERERNIQFLNLSRNQMTNKTFKTVCENLLINKAISLRDLSASGCQLSVDCLGPLADALTGNTSLLSLHLSHNNFSGHGQIYEYNKSAKVIVKQMKANTAEWLSELGAGIDKMDPKKHKKVHRVIARIYETKIHHNDAEALMGNHKRTPLPRFFEEYCRATHGIPKLAVAKQEELKRMVIQTHLNNTDVPRVTWFGVMMGWIDYAFGDASVPVDYHPMAIEVYLDTLKKIIPADKIEGKMGFIPCVVPLDKVMLAITGRKADAQRKAIPGTFDDWVDNPHVMKLVSSLDMHAMRTNSELKTTAYADPNMPKWAWEINLDVSLDAVMRTWYGMLSEGILVGKSGKNILAVRKKVVAELENLKATNASNNSARTFSPIAKHEAALRDLKGGKKKRKDSGCKKLFPKMAFAYAISRNKYLAHLDLAYTRLAVGRDGEELLYMTMILKHNRSLKSVHLSGNRVIFDQDGNARATQTAPYHIRANDVVKKGFRFQKPAPQRDQTANASYGEYSIDASHLRVVASRYLGHPNILRYDRWHFSSLCWVCDPMKPVRFAYVAPIMGPQPRKTLHLCAWCDGDRNGYGKGWSANICLFEKKDDNSASASSQSAEPAHRAASALQIRLRRARVLREYRQQGGDVMRDLDHFRRATKNKTDTVFVQACKKNFGWVVAKMLDLGEDPNQENRNVSTPLMHAIWPGHLDIVKLLVEGRADVNTKNLKRNTALHFAYEKRHFDIAVYLIENGADEHGRSLIKRRRPQDFDLDFHQRVRHTVHKRRRLRLSKWRSFMENFQSTLHFVSSMHISRTSISSKGRRKEATTENDFRSIIGDRNKLRDLNPIEGTIFCPVGVVRFHFLVDGNPIICEHVKVEDIVGKRYPLLDGLNKNMKITKAHVVTVSAGKEKTSSKGKEPSAAAAAAAAAAPQNSADGKGPKSESPITAVSPELLRVLKAVEKYRGEIAAMQQRTNRTRILPARRRASLLRRNRVASPTRRRRSHVTIRKKQSARVPSAQSRAISAKNKTTAQLLEASVKSPIKINATERAIAVLRDISSGEEQGTGVCVQLLSCFQKPESSFLSAYFTNHEIRACFSSSCPPASYAGRWAAKEAVMTALIDSAKTVLRKAKNRGRWKKSKSRYQANSAARRRKQAIESMRIAAKAWEGNSRSSGFPEDDDEDGDNDLSWSDDSSGDEMEQSNRVAHIPLTAVEEEKMKNLLSSQHLIDIEISSSPLTGEPAVILHGTPLEIARKEARVMDMQLSIGYTEHLAVAQVFMYGS